LDYRSADRSKKEGKDEHTIRKTDRRDRGRGGGLMDIAV